MTRGMSWASQCAGAGEAMSTFAGVYMGNSCTAVSLHWDTATGAESSQWNVSKSDCISSRPGWWHPPPNTSPPDETLALFPHLPAEWRRLSSLRRQRHKLLKVVESRILSPLTPLPAHPFTCWPEQACDKQENISLCEITEISGRLCPNNECFVVVVYLSK